MPTLQENRPTLARWACGQLKNHRLDLVFSGVIVLFLVGLYFLPSGFGERQDKQARRARGRIIEVDNSFVQNFGVVSSGSQNLKVEILSGEYAGQTVMSANHLLAKLDLDKFFTTGDTVLLVLTIREGEIIHAAAMDHYRLDSQAYLALGFAFFLVLFAGWTGIKALLSFTFTGMLIWRLLIPAFLRGWDPILMSLATVATLSAVIIFLVGGVSRKGLTAFLGAFLGLFFTCMLALLVVPSFRLHAAVKPFSETLLYSGYAHLDLGRIFLATIFLAASGAVMDLAMDVAASMQEVTRQHPAISRSQAILSGFRVGRAVLGTMTTTLLLAYSSSYIALLMVFMAQGIPMANMLNLNYIAAEYLNTILGSLGLITVAPLTAVIGGFILVPRHKH